MIKFINTETKIPYIILIIITIVSIYPFFYMISTSFMNVGEATNQYLFPKKLMFENYILHMHNPMLHHHATKVILC